MDSASIEAEYNEINSKNGWIGLFQVVYTHKKDFFFEKKSFCLIKKIKKS